MLRGGHSASEALDSLLVDDPRREQRQLAIVDAKGNVAAFTGEHCVRAAGHFTDEAVSAQANMVERDTTWSAMIAAYTRASGDLDNRPGGGARSCGRRGRRPSRDANRLA